MTEKQILGFKPAPRLEQVGDVPSACRIANIALKDAMILPYDANPGRMKFWGKDTQSGHCRMRRSGLPYAGAKCRVVIGADHRKVDPASLARRCSR
jgi:hypothetical protein